jgi:uncharacterized protein (DUF1501 family)
VPSDHDLTTADVRRLLDHPAGTGGADLSRRRFLLAAAAGAAATALPVPHLLGTAGAQTVGGAGGTSAAPATGAVDAAAAATAEAVLVIILMGGGNDGLSTLVPTGDASYYAARGALAIPGDRALDVGGGFGFHPNLVKLKRRFDSGQVAAVRGVGYANPDLSHFNSMALWMQGSAAGGPPTSGWAGRYLDGLGGGADDFHGIAIGSSVPLHVVGNVTRATALPTDGGSLFGADRSDATDARMFDCLSAMGAGSTGRGPWADAWARTGTAAVAQAQRVAGMYVPDLPDRDIGSQLVLAARLINAGLGIRVITTDFHGDFDTHASQPAHHDALMQELDDAVEAFYAALGANHVNRVVLMTMSEFGRRLRRNDSNGTDHGTASTLLVIGNRVRGGLHGTPPDLAHPDRNGNLVATVDFRSVYASVLGGWLGADANQVLGASYPALDLFTGPAGWTFPGIDGYWLATATGSVYTFGTAGFYGSVSGPPAPIVGMCASPTRKGYWLCDAAGGVYAFGDAGFHGSAASVRLTQPIVGMASSATGGGYWLVARDGGVFSFGDAAFFGSTGDIRLNRPVVGMCGVPGGQGYWFVATDGGIFSYGPDARFHGSTGALSLNQPVVGMTPTSAGDGYWMVASDGGIFAFGQAGFYGSTGGIALNQPIVGMAATPSGRGYWLIAADGGVFAFGDAHFEGAGTGIVDGTVVAVAS